VKEFKSYPKGVKAKPGKGKPTVAEKRWLDALVEHGCIACFTGHGGTGRPVEVHHILRGGRRLGHLFTLPLCVIHHRDGQTARHPYKARFEQAYGTELELLALLKLRLGVFDKAEYA